MEKIGIIIPVHNRLNYTKKCVESVFAQPYINFQLIVIDDGSSDGTYEFFRSEYYDNRRFTIIRGDGSYWWTKCINIGIKVALAESCDYILTLNDDTVMDNDFLVNMLSVAHQGYHILGACEKKIETHETIYIGTSENWLLGRDYPQKRLAEDGTLNKVTHLPGRGLFFYRDVIEHIGLFDEQNFPQYAADSDYTHRAREYGYELYCNLRAVLYTYPNDSVGKKAKNVSKLNIRETYCYFTSISSLGNLKIFLKYAVRHCPTLYLPIYISMGLMRRVLGFYLKEW